MAKPLFTAGEIARAINDGRKVAPRFWEGRVRTLIVNGLLVPDDRTEGGHLRFDLNSIALAAIYSELLDIGLSHVPPGKVAGATDSAFSATQFAFFGKPPQIEKAMSGVLSGDHWLLRLDYVISVTDKSRRWIGVAYPAADITNTGNPTTPIHTWEHHLSSVLVTLNPILLPIVTDRSGMN